MKVISFLLFLLFMNLSLTLKAQNKKQSEKINNNYFFGGKIEGLNGNTSIPITYADGLALIHVIIDGKDHVFLFDTGAMISLISQEIAGDSAVNGVTVSVADAKGDYKDRKIMQKDFTVGNVSFKGIGCAIADLKVFEQSGCIKIDGIFGENAIRFCNWKIDPVNQTMKLSEKAFKPTDNSFVFDLELNGVLPFIKVEFNNQRFWSMLDSGFSGILEINDSTYSAAPKSKTLPFASGIGTAMATINNKINQKFSFSKIDTVKIGKYIFTDLQSNVNANPNLIGAKFLYNYISVLNIKDKKMYLDPKSDNLPKSSIDLDFGFKFLLDENNKLQVSFVWDGSPAQKAGLKSGDKILKINEQTFEKITSEQFCSIKKEVSTKQKIKLVIQNSEGNNQEISLEKYNLFSSIE